MYDVLPSWPWNFLLLFAPAAAFHAIRPMPDELGPFASFASEFHVVAPRPSFAGRSKSFCVQSSDILYCGLLPCRIEDASRFASPLSPA